MVIDDFNEFDNHEAVINFLDIKSGLRAFVAIHNTNLGPATGGTRYLSYKKEEDALKDALRLSKAMTYKCALAGVPYGGGKAVIMAPKKRSVALFKAYAERINLLKGSYTTGEDVGIEEKDLRVMHEISPYINGRPAVGGALAPWTALGIEKAIEPALYSVYGSASFSGRKFAVKGLGKIGLALVERILEKGGEVYGADVNAKVVEEAKKIFPELKIVSTHKIRSLKVDVFSPCALGGEIDQKALRELKCSIVCGGANNQLANNNIGEKLHRKGILYIPDYLANAGGLINIVAEMRPQGYSENWVRDRVLNIKNTSKKVIVLSTKTNSPASEVADKLAEAIFKRKVKI
jgi:glutamate dehydrogenase/leucine dehydrogenase